LSVYVLFVIPAKAGIHIFFGIKYYDFCYGFPPAGE